MSTRLSDSYKDLPVAIATLLTIHREETRRLSKEQGVPRYKIARTPFLDVLGELLPALMHEQATGQRDHDLKLSKPQLSGNKE